MNSAPNDKLAEINRFLDKEIKSLHRTRTFVFFWGIFLMCLVCGYVFYLTRLINENAKEEQLGAIFSYALSENLEKTDVPLNAIIMKIPQYVASVKSDLIENLIPLRVNGNESLKKAFKDIFRNVDEVLQEEIKKQGSPYRQMIAEKLKTLADKETAEKELEDIDILMQEVIFNEVDIYLEFFLQNLKELEAKIVALLQKKELTEEEKKIKHFVVLWYNFFQFNWREK